MKRSIKAYIYADEGGYVVECPDVKAVTQGDTLDEAISNLKEVVALALEDAYLDESVFVSITNLKN